MMLGKVTFDEHVNVLERYCKGDITFIQREPCLKLFIYVVVVIKCQKRGNFLSLFATKFSRFHEMKTVV